MSEVDAPLTVFASGFRMNEFDQVAMMNYEEFPTTRKILLRDFNGTETTLVTEGEPAAWTYLSNCLTNSLSLFYSMTESVGFLANTDQGTLGIWIADADGVEKVAAVGDPAPGLPDGFQFFRVNNMRPNPIGQIAFSDLAVNPDTQEETIGLWIGNQDALTTSNSKRETQWKLQLGERRAVREIYASNNYGTRTGRDGHPTNFNEFGEIVFEVNFEEGGNALLFAGSEYVVNTESDGNDNDLGDGVCDTGGPLVEGRPECSLRAAIQQTNACPWQRKNHF